MIRVRNIDGGRKILEHQDWKPRSPYRRHLGGAANALGQLKEWTEAMARPAQGSIFARIYAGLWIVDCLMPGCAEASAVTSADPLYVCPNCVNVGNGDRPYAVLFPAPAERRAIEAALTKRPLDRLGQAPSRNWFPEETAASLRAENKRMGVS